MMDAPAREKMTAEEYLRLPETNLPLELIDGEIVRTPAPLDSHQVIVGNAYLWGRTTVRTGRWLLSPLDVYLDDLNVLQPDIAWVAPDSACVLREGKYWHGAPDLAIEVLSEGTSKRDRRTKFALYEAHGTREYWLLNPLDQSIELFVRQEERFVRQGLYYPEDTFTSPLLGVEVVVTVLFAAP